MRLSARRHQEPRPQPRYRQSVFVVTVKPVIVAPPFHEFFVSCGLTAGVRVFAYFFSLSQGQAAENLDCWFLEAEAIDGIGHRIA